MSWYNSLRQLLQKLWAPDMNINAMTAVSVISVLELWDWVDQPF